jgi:hypothetical protein
MTNSAVSDLEQSNLEDAVTAAITKRLGYGPEILSGDDNENFGVVPFIRLEGYELNKIDWQEIAAELARGTGVGVTCIANCDWSPKKGPDEEATFISFDVPGLPNSYRDDPHRNMIEAVDPVTAPSEADFASLKRARKILKGRLEELRGRYEVLIAADRDVREVLGSIEATEKLQELGAGDREAVRAVLELDFDTAAATVLADSETASFRP